MRNAIKEYIELNNREKEDLWKTATFVFDTNVFLNLYRYSNNTREQLINSFEMLKTRIWMPYQVALEFCKDRYGVIDESNRRFDNILSEADKLMGSWKKELRLDNNDSDINDLDKYLKTWITKKRESNYLTLSATEDEVFDRLLDLFDGKVGKPFETEERMKVEQEGEKRYIDKTPPGYKDNQKTENKFGDLLVWMEIIGYAKSKKADIIFVTHDQKEDWWNTFNGKTIGPRIELRKEFYEKTGKMFHMYTMSSFLSLFTQDNGSYIDKKTMDEVELVASVIRNTKNYDEIKGYYDSQEVNVTKLKSDINRIERKNRNRRRSISALQKKKMTGELSEEDTLALQRNKENLIDGIAQIKRLDNILKALMLNA